MCDVTNRTTFARILRFNWRMGDFLAEHVRVSDLRGRAAPAPGTAVLEDPTGRRRRRLRLAGRAIALALTLWLVALVAGGVGLNPVPGVPFAHILKPAAPPTTRHEPPPAPPSASDLEPALPARSAKRVVAAQPIPVPGQGTTHSVSAKRTPAAAKRHAVAVHTMTPAVDGAPAAAPHGPAASHPNNGKHAGSTTTTTTPTTTTTTTPGHSGGAPGQTGTTPGRLKSPSTTLGP